MKLRLYDDSLRLRLSQSEVAQFERAGRVESTVPFPGGRSLIYSIAAADVTELSATLNDGRVAVLCTQANGAHLAVSGPNRHGEFLFDSTYPDREGLPMPAPLDRGGCGRVPESAPRRLNRPSD
ncbi:MAG TPA: hypothetical protein VEV85_05020 [Bryobacteraceae bacterium]|nr:hypothetical protein [Bryobacteraceae bacterium]